MTVLNRVYNFGLNQGLIEAPKGQNALKSYIANPHQEHSDPIVMTQLKGTNQENSLFHVISLAAKVFIAGISVALFAEPEAIFRNLQAQFRFCFALLMFQYSLRNDPQMSQKFFDATIMAAEKMKHETQLGKNSQIDAAVALLKETSAKNERNFEACRQGFDQGGRRVIQVRFSSNSVE